MRAQSSPMRGYSTGWCRLAGGALAAMLLALPLAACQGDRFGPGPHGSAMAAGDQAYYAGPEVVALDLPARDGEMSPAERRAVGDFVTAYSYEGEGPLEIASPTSQQAQMVVGKVRQISRAEGVPASALSYADYPSKDGSLVTLSYQRHAKGEECGRWPSNLGSGWRNEPYENFGCATRRNLAVMVEDPRDLQGPRPMTPRDSERRDEIFANHRRGVETGAQTQTDNVDGLGN